MHHIMIKLSRIIRPGVRFRVRRYQNISENWNSQLPSWRSVYSEDKARKSACASRDYLYNVWWDDIEIIATFK